MSTVGSGHIYCSLLLKEGSNIVGLAGGVMLASASEVVGLTIGMFGLLFRECLLCQPQAEVQEATKLTVVHEQNIFGF